MQKATHRNFLLITALQQAIAVRLPSAGSRAVTFYFEDDSFAEQDVGGPLPIILVRQSGEVEVLRGLSQDRFDVSDEIPDEWDGV